MFGSAKLAVGTALVGALALTASACSGSGGAQEEQDLQSGAVGQADTKPMEFAMITHAPAGDTFFDIIRAGADAAAEKDNVTYEYSNDIDSSKQAVLVESAINNDVDGIAVTLPNADALSGVLKKAEAAGIPVVAFNAGADDWQDVGALMYFGQDETLAGQEAGKQLNEDGAKKVLCVLQAQGQVQLESRCGGLQETFSGTVEKLYVNGTDMPSVRSTIGAKLTEDPSIDHVVTLAAPIALTALQSVEESGSSAKVVTFDTSAELVPAIQSGDVEWAIDQQPYLQGYLAIDSLWLYNTNRNILGGGQPVLTGPSFITAENVDDIAPYAERGTR